MFTNDQIQVLIRAKNDFVYFLNNIFSLSFKGSFISGDYVTKVGRFLSQNKKTIRISAKAHMKSTSLYAYFMWKLLFQGASENIECHYLSFQEQMAGYHVGKIKRLIEANPYYDEIIDLKPTAESMIKYTWDRKHNISLEPHGLIQFKRGIHGDIIFVDDPFQDPQNEMVPTSIYKVNEIFKSNILDMPKEPDGELHVVGTPQTREDFFFDPHITNRFAVLILPAIKEGRALWPEYMSIEELNEKRIERTERIFNREYLCNPVYSTNAFFNRDLLIAKAVNANLVNLKLMSKYDIKNDVIAGFDIGKKLHPSHLAVFEVRDGKWVMIHHKFMRGWSYSNGSNYFPPNPTQLEYLKEAIKVFCIDKLFFDNTRGEFESFIEQDLLAPQMIPITTTHKLKVKMSTEFDKAVENSEIELINDDDLLNSVSSVTNDLMAIESAATGHGDAFWSIGLALLGKGDLLTARSSNVQARAGNKSIFAQGSKVPRGW
jgi:hypothetical protein